MQITLWYVQCCAFQSQMKGRTDDLVGGLLSCLPSPLSQASLYRCQSVIFVWSRALTLKKHRCRSQVDDLNDDHMETFHARLQGAEGVTFGNVEHAHVA